MLLFCVCVCVYTHVKPQQEMLTRILSCFEYENESSDILPTPHLEADRYHMLVAHELTDPSISCTHQVISACATSKEGFT